MKHLLTAMLLLIVSLASAQIVNIPDPDFKNELVNYSPAIDVNHDGEIQVSEALAVHNLLLYSTNLTGIREFANLDSLSSTGNTSSLDLSDMANLRMLSVFATPSLNLSGCLNLEFLSFGNLGSTATSDLTISLPRLKTINCLAPQVGNMILTGCDSLRKIYLPEGQGIDKLDISGLNQIDTLTISNINRLIARNCTALKVIRGGAFFGSVRDELDVTGCIKLYKIMLVETYCPTLDLTTCSSLKIFMITGQSADLQNLNIKNGLQLDSIYLFCSTAPTTALNICADDFEIDSVSHMITRNQSLLFPRPFYVNSYCSFYPAGAYNTINGTIKLDLHNDGCDVSDAGMPYVAVKYTDTSGQSTINYTGASGDYSVYTNKGIFTVAPYFPYAYFTTNPVTANVIFDTANSLISTNNFCIAPNGVHNDLDISCLPLTPARPGSHAIYNLIYKNKGTTIQSGSIQLNYANNKVNFNYASTAPSSQTSGQLAWSYSNLAPFESRTITVLFDVFAPPINNFGDTLIYLAAVNPIMGDETPQDNSFILPQNVISSYDPNDKQCLEGSLVGFDDLEKSLHYIIRFQNTGTDTAFNVVVVDSLSDKFDWNSVEIISTSHPCDIQQKNGKLEFYFQNIKLPYAAINEPGSHGYVAFSIKPKSAVTIGDSLNNRAAIYFDFNLPVITNTATTIVSPASPVPVKLEYFTVSRKDATNVLTWKAPSTSGTTIFNIERSPNGIAFRKFGEVTATAERSQLPFNFTDAYPLTGKNYYRLKITDADGVSFYSKILVIGNNKSGLDIIAVTNDHTNVLVYLNSDKKQKTEMKVVAADGRLVYSESKSLLAGSSTISLPLRKLSTGVYSLVVCANAGEIITRRFIK